MPTAFLQTLTILFLLLPAGLLCAAEPSELMHRLNEEGFEAFQGGRFTEAAGKFRAAYEISAEPNLRKNETIAWFKAGNCPEAVPAANDFLMSPGTEESDQAEVRSVLANCRVEMARSAMEAGSFELAAVLLGEAERLDPDDRAKVQIVEMRKTLADRESVPAEVKQEPPAPEEPSVAGPWLAGAGGVVLALAFGYQMAALAWDANRDDLKDVPGQQARRDELDGRLDTAAWLVPTMYGLGAVTTGLGVYLIVTSGPSESSSKASAMSVRGGFVFDY